MKKKSASRLLAILLVVMVVYATVVVFLQRGLVNDTKRAILESQLSSYLELVHNAYTQGKIEDALPLLPDYVRVTVVENEGRVSLDTDVDRVGDMENHDTRPELQEARFHHYGTAKRTSVSSGLPTYYYAKFYRDYYIRLGIPVSYVNQSEYVYSTKYFIYISFITFIVLIVLLYLLYRKYEYSIVQLNKITEELSQNIPLSNISIPSGDLGKIAQQIFSVFNQKEEAMRGIVDARERLTLHFQLSNVGIALFNKHGEAEFSNSHFIQYANMLATRPMSDVSAILEEPQLLQIKRFIEDKSDTPRTFGITVAQSNRIFEVKALKSGDGSYEMTIADVTEQEKNRILKQEMTSNITHEIRTPLTSIRGYLETLHFMDLSQEKQAEFIEKAYNQALRISEMMEDIRLLTKLDEGTRPFEFVNVNMRQLVEEVRVSYTAQFTELGNVFRNELPGHITIYGNQTLLYSIFQNLVENSNRYAGGGVEIVVSCYHEDENYVYLSYYDTGKGVSEQHLNRLFERFYRVDGGRTRMSGGSGLGLSIVKNAISLHGGQIQARPHSSGGLELLFNLHK